MLFHLGYKKIGVENFQSMSLLEKVRFFRGPSLKDQQKRRSFIDEKKFTYFQGT